MTSDSGIRAKLVYYGPDGSGKTANVRCIHRKLKRGHRGELEVMKVGTQSYEILPVHLGQIRGFKTSIDVCSVPGGPEYADQRCEIVRNADGVVFVADLRPDRYQATLSSLRELQSHLRQHGRSLRDILLIIQYNHRDEADENDVDRLHRSIRLKPAASFEAVAPEGTGVLPCLTTISKLILADLRNRADQEAQIDDGVPSEPTPLPAEEPRTVQELAELNAAIQAGGASPFMLASAGQPVVRAGEITIPIRLRHRKTGEEVELRLKVSAQ